VASTPAAVSKPVPLRAHPHLFEINTWTWLEQISARLGRAVRLGDAPDAEWDALARRGFDIVWLMGVWRRSAESRRLALSDTANFAQYDRARPGWRPEDVIASPYAVAEYVPDARIGSWEDVDAAREKLHARGMALFLDFVGNHTALDHRWTREHPEFYVQGTQQDFENDPGSFYRVETPQGTRFLALGKDPYFPPWRDTVQLNHFEAGMRAAEITELRKIASHCDGVRCDMAMLHLSDIFERIWGRFLRGAQAPTKEFWSEAHAEVPELILLAEAYWGTEQRLLDLGFAFAYDKGLYDAVRDGNVAEIHARLGAEAAWRGRAARSLENHDEARAAAVFGARLGAAATLMGTLAGMRFYHQGEAEGRKIHLPITLRLPAEEPSDPAAAALFERILRVTNQPVFHEGEWRLLKVTAEGDAPPDNLVAYEWRTGNAWKMIVVNPGGSVSQGRIALGDRVSRAQDYIFQDELDDVRYPRSGAELTERGLFVRREAYQAHLFDIRAT